MKKILPLVIILAMMIAMLVSCNYGVIDTTYTFDRAIIAIGDQVIEVEVDSWIDYEDSDQIQVKATDGTVYFTDSTRCVLIKDKK